MKTSEILAKLKAMATKAGEAIFERAKLADEVLTDKAWLDSEFQGDHDRAMEVVEADYFPELATAFGLSSLLTLAREFPDVATWRQHKFNLSKLWAEYEERHKEETPKIERRKQPKIADVEERDEKIKELEWVAKNTKDALAVKETELERLRRENDELRGENRALQRMLDQIRQERRQLVA